VIEHVWLEHTSIPLAIAFIVALALERSHVSNALPALLACLSAGSAILLVGLIVNHVRFPFQIDIMEGVVMQHARRVMHGQSIYPVPSPAFVPLAYNALFYLLAAPFLIVFGDTLATLRMVSVIGFVGSAAAIFVIVRTTTRSPWWAAIAVGLFCAAYPAMDAYLDSAHADAWLLCCALWGTHLVGQASRRARVAGILVLVASFWFKQHGAVFLGSALLFLTWREGFRKAMAYWIVAFAACPLLYFVSQGILLGEEFHFFTWHVPSGWSELNIRTVVRLLRFIKTNYPILVLAALASVYRALRSRSIGILEVQLGAAFLTALMGSLDPGSSDNVFIPMGAFLILCGTIELARLQSDVPVWFGVRPGLAAALLAFATLVHDPRRFWLPASARASYAELQATIRALPGAVYAPGIGEFVDGPRLYPTAHWIALEDIMRGPRRVASDSGLSRRMLDPVRHPAAAAFILTNRPLATMSAPVGELAASYTLVQDWGDRFESLEMLPRPWDSGWPRYLYRFTGTRVGDNGH
jgi:hypothetical protein